MLVICPLLGGLAARSGRRAGSAGRIAAGASATLVAQRRRRRSTGMGGERSREPAIGRQTCGRAQRCRPPCRHGRCAAVMLRAPGIAAPSGCGERRRRDRCRARRRTTSAGARDRRGIDRPAEEPPAAARRSGCGSASRPAGPWRAGRHRHARPPASPRARRTAAPPGPSGSSRASFWNFSAACIGLTSANSIWNSETGTMPKASPRPSSSALGVGGAAPRGSSRGTPPAMPRVEAKSQGAPMVTSAATSAGAPRREPDRQRAAHAVAEHRHRPAGRAGTPRQRRQPAARRRSRRGRSPPRARPGVAPVHQDRPQPLRRQPAQHRAAGREVEDVGAVDQARHHEHRRAVRVARLRRRAVVEQPRAALRPDRRRVGERRGGRGAPARSRGRDGRLQPRGDLARDLELVEVAAERGARSAPRPRPRESSGCRRAAPRAAPGRRPRAPRRGGRSAGSAPRPGAAPEAASRRLADPGRRPDRRTRRLGECRSQRSR